MTDSRYHRQRAERRDHPNRKDEKKPYHDTDRPYMDVAGEIESGIARFKREQADLAARRRTEGQA
jgi:hypothetical protein